MKIRHPAFPEIVKDVRAYASWRDAGWVLVDQPEESKPEPVEEPGDAE